MLYENYIDRLKNYHDLKEYIGIDVVNLSGNILYLNDKYYTSLLDTDLIVTVFNTGHLKKALLL